MATHGVSLPLRQRSNNATPPSNGQRTGPVGGGARFLLPPAGVDPTKYQAALNACRSQIFNGARLSGSGRARTPGLPAGHVVVYKVTSSAHSASIVYVDSGGANNAQASVPYQMTVTLTSGAPFSVIAQGVDASSISCEVLVDGRTITTNAAITPALAECNGIVP
ncbi:MAG: MmpS family transport accessory protein [Acidimicrobiia bacterium]